jgi:hypothetical protein
VPGSLGLQSTAVDPSLRTPMPTFTYPPGVAFLPTQEMIQEATAQPLSTAPDENTDSFPPVVPILLLGGLGVLGLAVSSLKR